MPQVSPEAPIALPMILMAFTVVLADLIVMGLLMLSACGLITERGVYEGARQQQQIRRDPGQSDAPSLPAYDKYKQERDKLAPSSE
jgi:hypothetical protein